MNDPKLTDSDSSEEVSFVSQRTLLNLVLPHLPISRYAFSPFQLGIGVGFVLCLLLWAVMDFSSVPEPNSQSESSGSGVQSAASDDSLVGDLGVVPSSSVGQMVGDGIDAGGKDSTLAVGLGGVGRALAGDAGEKIEAVRHPIRQASDAGVRDTKGDVVEQNVRIPEGMVLVDRGFLHRRHH